MLVEYVKTSQSTLLDTEVQELLLPYINGTKGGNPKLEEGEVPKRMTTDLTKAAIPTVMIGTSEPTKERLKSKVELIEPEVGHRKKDQVTSKRSRTDEDPKRSQKISKR